MNTHNYISPKILDAMEYSALAHVGQVRKGTQRVPYLSHPATVGLILARAGFSETVIMAGILHDVIEDTTVTFLQLKERFGQTVADLVFAVSEDADMPHPERSKVYRESFRTASPEVKAIGAADSMANLTNILLMHAHGEPVVQSIFRGNVADGLASRRSKYEAVAYKFDHPIMKDYNSLLNELEALLV